ncbi:MAG: hypothetical protein LBN07_01815 [Christensenellaceae bacterium]|jgi:hypothetical protein|nr:hypothetical protein [Christensenellaceae bacterium]
MSYYTCGNSRGNCPGPLNGNALNGICERAVIEVNKVLDACMKQTQLQNVQVTITNLTPINPALPLTFVSAGNNGPAEISNLVVDRLLDKPNFARVSANVTIPITISYTDANGVPGSGEGILTSSLDVVLFVPQPAITPYSIEVFGSINGAIGNFVEGSTFSISCCMTVVAKVVVNADILVPTYGYSTPPQCKDYTQQICSGAMSLPIFPSAL